MYALKLCAACAAVKSVLYILTTAILPLNHLVRVVEPPISKGSFTGVVVDKVPVASCTPFKYMYATPNEFLVNTA